MINQAQALHMEGFVFIVVSEKFRITNNQIPLKKTKSLSLLLMR